MKRRDLHPLAEQELFKSARFYEEEKRGLGEDFLDEFDALVERLLIYPESSPFLSKNVKVARIRRFPFNVLYTVESDRIFVVAVMHQSRRPGYWKDRL